MNKDTEIIFINKGTSWFLPYVIHQARHASPASEVVLIADRDLCRGIRCELLDSLESDDLADFRKSYVHMSTNPEQFELFCWERWFYLRNYMREKGVGSVLYLDSDVLLYSSVEEITDAYPGVTWRCGLSAPKQGPASGHISYWTLGMLEDYCDFTITTFRERRYLAIYEEKWQRHVAGNEPGGVCDMTTLHLFYESRRDRVMNLARRGEGGVFDNNMNSGSNYEEDEYLTAEGIKRIKFIGECPFFLGSVPSGSPVRAHALHFQGSAKMQIRRFYTGPPFPGRNRSDAVFLYHYLARTLGRRARRLCSNDPTP